MATNNELGGEVANKRDRTPARASNARNGHETGTKRTRKGHGLGAVFPTLNVHNHRTHQRLRRRTKHSVPRPRHGPARRAHPARCALSASFSPPLHVLRASAEHRSLRMAKRTRPSTSLP